MKFNDFRFVTLSIATLMLAWNAVVINELEAKERRVPASKAAIQHSFAPIVKKAAQAVVNVYVRQKQVRKRRFGSLLDDPFFERFFGRGPGRKRMENSLGSGVIINASGLVVTNYHVIADGQGGEIKIAFADKREYPAKLVLKDEKTDLAVLKIVSQGERFPFLEIGNSDTLEVGDLVLAIGNPFGVGQTVTSGIVSALARTQVGVSSYQSFIQTDAAINPGNSGGALIDMDGRLVGINTAIFSKSGGSLGIGFAVPSNMVKLVAQSARSGNRVRRPWFGADLQDVTPDIAASLGFKKPSGVILASISRQSPAADAGLRSGDIILAVDDKETINHQQFLYRFSAKGIGGRLPLKVWRNGRVRTFRINLEAAPERPSRDRMDLRGDHPFNGSTIVNLSPAVSEEFGMSRTHGVMVAQVRRGTAAQSIGLKSKDVILRIGQTNIKSTKQFRSLLRYGRRYWRISILRGDEVLNFVLGG